MSKRAITVIGVALAVAAGIGIAMRAGTNRTPAPAAAPTAETMVELAASDVTRAQATDLEQGLAITGTLRAVNSAVVKARVAGELQGLTVREGDTVRAGQVIASIDPTEYRARLQQAREQADAAKAQVDIARRQFDNNKALVDKGFISRTALESSQSSLAAAEATHKAALAAVDVAGKTLDDSSLRAPIAGVVSQRLAQPGERLGVDARVIEIVDPGRLELEATVTAADSVRVRAGQPARLTVEGAAQPVAATVARINPSAQAGSRGVPVYLQLPPTTGLRQGLFAQGVLVTERVRALAVPLQAVRTDRPAPYVQVVEGERVRHKPVQTGARAESGGQVLVAVSGVDAGALVILGHVGALREGTAVKFTKPATAAPARAAP
ncbi:MAG: efflux RND transporter periplasmic adaptor subunit [Ramlibacter sp.]|jgi:RND family efflux transporter MFP subunit